MRRLSQLVGLAVLVGCSGSGGSETGPAASGGSDATGGSGATGGSSAATGGSDATTGGSSAGGSSGSHPASGGSNASGSGGSSAGDGAGASGESTSSGGSGTAGHAGSAGAGARPPVDDGCGLPDPAFCDTFTQPSPGGRAGDLDDAKWSFSRLGFGCGTGFSFPPTPLNLCGSWQTVDPGGPDSRFCKDENDVPHWVEGFDDNHTFGYIAARIRQPFDFAGRTGTLQWEADARTSGSHGWWVETWITEEPVPGVNLHNDQLVSSKEAIGVRLSLNCGVASPAGTAGSGKVGVDRVMVLHDYQVTDVYDPFSSSNANSRCVTTEQGVLNKFQFKLSQSRLEVWATDAGGSDLTRIAEADVDLPFSRGYVHISHVHYNAEKVEVSSFQTYQWARVTFDGPVVSTPRAYEIPDALSNFPGTTACDPNGFAMSYGLQDGVAYDLGKSPDEPIALVFKDVDPSGGTKARINFDTTFVSAGDVLRVRLNGKDWHDYTVPAINTTWERQGFSIAIPAADLVEGDNALELATNTASFAMPPNGMQIANIDLELETE
jgi:hypothetical protein